MTHQLTPTDLEKLALTIRPEWADPPHYGNLKTTLYQLTRTTTPTELATPLARCYQDPETRDPRRLTHTGPQCHWWKNPTTTRPRTPFQANQLPPRGQSTPDARARAKAAAAGQPINDLYPTEETSQ